MGAKSTVRSRKQLVTMYSFTYTGPLSRIKEYILDTFWGYKSTQSCNPSQGRWSKRGGLNMSTFLAISGYTVHWLYRSFSPYKVLISQLYSSSTLACPFLGHGLQGHHHPCLAAACITKSGLQCFLAYSTTTDCTMRKWPFSTTVPLL